MHAGQARHLSLAKEFVKDLANKTGGFLRSIEQAGLGTHRRKQSPRRCSKSAKYTYSMNSMNSKGISRKLQEYAKKTRFHTICVQGPPRCREKSHTECGVRSPISLPLSRRILRITENPPKDMKKEFGVFFNYIL